MNLMSERITGRSEFTQSHLFINTLHSHSARRIRIERLFVGVGKTVSS